MRVLLCFALLSACTKPPVATVTTTVVQDTPIRVSQNAQDKVDILFMVDNSPSMDAMQAELVSKFHTFLGVFDALAHPTDGSTPQYADLQIGVVTSGCRSPILEKNIALCRMDVNYAAIGTEVEVGRIDGHQKRIPARVVRFPFYDPEKKKPRS